MSQYGNEPSEGVPPRGAAFIAPALKEIPRVLAAVRHEQASEREQMFLCDLRGPLYRFNDIHYIRPTTTAAAGPRPARQTRRAAAAASQQASRERRAAAAASRPASS